MLAGISMKVIVPEVFLLIHTSGDLMEIPVMFLLA